MRFLEKDLETIIWENYSKCYERGLDIHCFDFDNITSAGFRQLSLGGYGIADLVNIELDSISKYVFIQVIECKKDDINAATYGQAKRYMYAIKQLFLRRGIIDYDWEIRQEIVLIGRNFDRSGDFEFICEEDDFCTALTYDYTIDGLQFSTVGRPAFRQGSQPEHAAYKWLLTPIYQMMEDLSIASKALRESAAEQICLAGDWREPILIGIDGCRLNVPMLMPDFTPIPF